MHFQKKSILCTVILVSIAGVFLAFTYSAHHSDKTTPVTAIKRTSRIYNGINEKPRYSRSSLSLSDLSYTFEPALQGDTIEHDFFLKNDRKERIELKGIKSCCGILLTHVTPEILPGEEGKLSILMITDKYGGKQIHGTIQGQLSGTTQHPFSLDVSMIVNKVASVSDHKIILKGQHTSNLSGKTLLIPEPDYPFRVTGLKAKKGLHIDYTFGETHKNEKVSYLIQVMNKKKHPGVYRDTLFVQTDNPKRPEIRIRVEGHIY